MQSNHQKISSAYSEVTEFTRNHYENFPVISLLIPKELRKHVAVIYWFARTADDIADEGTISSSERIKLLEGFEQRFRSVLNQEFTGSYDAALFNTITEKKLTPKYFTDLLSAFKQDVIIKRYNSYADLLDYCSRSANPVGRLMLELFNIRFEPALLYSDKICTALQITNFLQDVKIDYLKGRIYIPQEELALFGVEETAFEINQINSNFKELIKFNVERTMKMFSEGKHLSGFLKGRFKREIKWTIAGGMEVLGKIKENDYDVLNHRPVLKKIDFIRLFFKSLL